MNIDKLKKEELKVIAKCLSQRLKDAEEDLEKERAIGKSSNITGCTFIGAQYDEKAVESITEIAAGLKQNAISLGKLADLLNSSSVTVDCMIKMDGGIS